MRGSATRNGTKAAFLGVALLAVAFAAVGAFHFRHSANLAQASSRQVDARKLIASAEKTLPLKSLSLPLAFEPNQGQTASQVEFLARGSGYGLFLTADEAVLDLHRAARHQGSSAATAVIRMRLDGASSSTRVSGASPLPGKSSYFIGNDPAKWHQDIPQFAKVEYKSVYPGVDLVYYGDQGRLEYDFRVAPGAEPTSIALNFSGAAAHVDAKSGDLILSTGQGDVRFLAPRVYQPAITNSASREKAVTGSFRQIAENEIGFSIGEYDHSRDLVIDPLLSYSTFLGGSGTEGLVKLAVGGDLSMYVAGSTNSTDFPTTDGSSLTGTQNIFISKINPLAGTGNSQLIYSIYLGGSGTDTLAGIAVDGNNAIYVGGSTSSPNFPVTLNNAFQTAPEVAGTHGFLTKIGLGQPPNLTYSLSYSTYLSGNGVDHVTGIAIDASNQNAYATGDTTSTDDQSNGFPSNPNAFQLTSNSPGNPQFFATWINTTGSGFQSIRYSTYFGGGNPTNATAVGGSIAVDPTSSNVNMYFTGTTNMLPVVGPDGEPKFPLFNAQQSCLNEPSKTGTCDSNNPSSNTDGFVAKINPNLAGSNPVYSTYIGGSGTEAALGIAVDSSGSTYVVGSTNSTDWVCSACVAGFQEAFGGASDGFMVKIGNLSGSIFPLTYFTYLGGSGTDSIRDVKVDSVQGAHLVGSTTSPVLPVTNDAFQPTYAGGGDAFVALISTTATGNATGDYLTYLGGSQLDQGTGIALDLFNATYVAGNTISANFPVTPATAFQPTLNAGSQDAFVTKVGADSNIVISKSSTSPTPNPVAAGTQAAFTFNIINQGPDNATNVTFFATVPNNGLATSASAKITSGTGSCTPIQGTTIICNIPTLAACTGTCTVGASVEVDATPSITGNLTQLTVCGSASANGGTAQGNPVCQTANVTDFQMSASISPATINAGDSATVQVTFQAVNPNLGYNATITPSQTTSPSMVTATTPTFNPTTVVLSGSAAGTTTLSIATVARPVNTGSLFRRGSFYATWLPVGGMSLVGFGLAGGRKRRRWLLAATLGMVAGVILLLPSCGGSSSATSTTGGTSAGNYTITITGSAGTGASHTAQAILTVH